MIQTRRDQLQGSHGNGPEKLKDLPDVTKSEELQATVWEGFQADALPLRVARETSRAPGASTLVKTTSSEPPMAGELGLDEATTERVILRVHARLQRGEVFRPRPCRRTPHAADVPPDLADSRRQTPLPHVQFPKRTQLELATYDWLAGSDRAGRQPHPGPRRGHEWYRATGAGLAGGEARGRRDGRRQSWRVEREGGRARDGRGERGLAVLARKGKKERLVPIGERALS